MLKNVKNTGRAIQDLVGSFFYQNFVQNQKKCLQKKPQKNLKTLHRN